MENAKFLWKSAGEVLRAYSRTRYDACTSTIRLRRASDEKLAGEKPDHGGRKPDGPATADTKFDAALASPRGRAQIEFSC